MFARFVVESSPAIAFDAARFQAGHFPFHPGEDALCHVIRVHSGFCRQNVGSTAARGPPPRSIGFRN
jgi:hypothetical protein